LETENLPDHTVRLSFRFPPGEKHTLKVEIDSIPLE
jgi:hypothetical protein